MALYQGYTYFLDVDDLWKVVLEDGILYVVALDDSKDSGRKKINQEHNTEERCMAFIDRIVNLV